MEFKFLLDKKYRIAWHGLFWVVVFVFYTFFFGHQSQNYNETILFVLPLLLVTAVTVYFINYFLFPRFLTNGKYKLLLLYSIYTFIVSIWLETLVVVSIVTIFIFGRGILLDHSSIDIFFLVVGMYFIIFIAVGIRLLKLWYEKQNTLQIVAKEKLEAELKLLKSQIHPHFLFNTLNNIYALAMKKSDMAPEMILKLSEILDYLLYECDVEKVPLQKEIDLINNYISLEKIRYSDRLDMTINLSGVTNNTFISPLILLPFVENSFKHGVAKKRKDAWIKLDLAVKNNVLKFIISNNKVLESEKSVGGGIGLYNVKKRLEADYHNKYNLDIKDENETYTIHLNIELV